MAEHIYMKEDLIQRFDGILNKTLEEIDDQGMFEHVQEFNLQKGVVGAVIEQCVLGYPPDTKQDADLVVIEDGAETKTELKSTGMVIVSEPQKHYVAKEPMSITAVGVYDLAEQEFTTSHFWNKLEHMLLVYYHYAADHAVTAYEYRAFPIRGYEFHEFSEDERAGLKQDWEYVRALAERVTSHHDGPKDKAWKEAVKEKYIEVHGELRRVLTYIDLAPKFPPRFRLKKPVVSTMIARHFQYALEQLPGRYTVVSDIDRKCHEITQRYAGKTIDELAVELGIDPSIGGKALAERITVVMFGGTSGKLNQIEVFRRFGLVAKTITLTPSGSKTEDMKLFHIDFDEMTQTEITEDDGTTREALFEDSELYSYFADHEFLCILFEEPAKEYHIDQDTGDRQEVEHPLSMNKFLGFKRLVFSDEFIDGPVRYLWDDIREKILGGTLVDIVSRTKDGEPVIISSGEVSSAPNFLKSSQNAVFVRGSGTNSSMKHKTECVNRIRMLPQYVWLKGSSVVDELEKIPSL